MDFSQLKKKQKINYIGESFAFGGIYTVYPIEETYEEERLCPEEDRGKLVIIELMNDGTPMFFPLDVLDPKEWEIADK